MADTTGNSSRERSFAATETDGRVGAKQLALLIGLGAGIILLEMAFRVPLKLPGHHGLEAMALMLFGRLSSRYAWAATIVGASAGTTGLVLGVGHGALMPVFYLLPGVLLDLAFRLRPLWRSSLFLLPLIGGLAWTSRPLLRWLAAQGLDLQFGSLSSGLALPVATHLAFGTAGALAATIVWRQWQKKKEGTP
jgi:hypothetical protein